MLGFLWSLFFMCRGVPEHTADVVMCGCGDPEFGLFSLVTNDFFSLCDDFRSGLKMNTVSGAAALSQLRSFVYCWTF